MIDHVQWIVDFTIGKAVVLSMNRAQLFVALHDTFTGKPGEKYSTIEAYEKLTPEQGLAKAKKYMDYAVRGQDNCQSDMTYWMYEGDKTLAALLIAIFERLVKGKNEFPALPENLSEQVLMDRAYYLQQWAARL